MRIVIVADAGPDVGLGHVARCTGTAQGLAAVTHERPVFYLRDRVARAWIEERGFVTVQTLPKQIPLLIVDSYRSSASTWKEYRRRARRLMVVDDYGAVQSSPDWILNSSPFAHRYPYQKVHAHSLMLGPLFHPLREEFWPELRSKRVRPTVREVLVMLGGGDQGSDLSLLMQWVREALPEVKLHIIVGPYTQVHEKDSRMVVHRSPSNVRLVLEQCDLAVSAAGQTLFELAACGIPTLAIQIIENQKPNFRGFRDLGGILALGSIKSRDLPARLKRELRRVARDATVRQRLADTARNIVDGKGALRIAHAVGEF
ncbi:MAG: hypothetical protein QOE70_3691 [Chthoniobacter sp.]|jgi:spore coat polysaccharide biosynthesis predicted glycosyltransferase SpsG|nr:hypothetical protein [Chthoniobacter sp.]